MDKEQQPLLSEEMDQTEWKKHWQGMPEFHQPDKSSARRIYVHFRNDEDVKAFSELIGQMITPKQKSLWFPQMEIRDRLSQRYEDES